MGKTESRALVAPQMMVLLVLCVPTAGGEDAPLRVGARVRVSVTKGLPEGRATSGKVTGTLLGLSETAITIDAKKETPLVLPRQEVTKLELSLRRGRRGRGALIGLGVGVAAAVVVGLAAGSDENCSFECFSAAELGGMFSLLFGPAGAAMGAAVAPGERWQTMAPDRIRLGPGGNPGPRPAIAFTLRF